MPVRKGIAYLEHLGVEDGGDGLDDGVDVGF